MRLVKILKVIPYENAVAMEYEIEPGYPQTFTWSWVDLEAQLEVRKRTPEELQRECVALAALLLKQTVDAEQRDVEEGKSLLDIANEAVK